MSTRCQCSAACTCGRGFTSPAAAGRAGLRLSALWDRARDAYGRAGLRPYSVTIVRARATGQRARGDGPTEVVGHWPILPTPLIGDLTGISEMLGSDQLREMGTVQLSEISLAYSEDLLQGRGESGAPIPNGEIFFYELRLIDGTGRAAPRRRFVPNSPPAFDPARAMWSIVLLRAPWDRDRAGALR